MTMTLQLEIFGRSIKNYFAELGAGEVEVGDPFVKNGQGIYLDMTGSISISGLYMGAIYVSVSQGMIEKITQHVLVADSVTGEETVDMMGEFTNTVVGNVSDQFGQGFNISVPMVIQGQISEVNLPRLKQPIYVIPFTWQGNKAYFLVGLEHIS